MPIAGSFSYHFPCLECVSQMELLFLLTCKVCLEVLGLAYLLSRSLSLSFIYPHTNILFILLKDP